MIPFNLEQALAGTPFTNDKGWTVEDWYYFKGAKSPVFVRWKNRSWVEGITESELFMLPEKKKVWIVVYESDNYGIKSHVYEDKQNLDDYLSATSIRILETIEKEYEL